MDGVLLIEAIGTSGVASIGISRTTSGKAWVIEAVGTSRITLAGVPLEAFTLEDYDLACKAFSNFLYFANANKPLTEPLKMKR